MLGVEEGRPKDSICLTVPSNKVDTGFVAKGFWLWLVIEIDLNDELSSAQYLVSPMV